MFKNEASCCTLPRDYLFNNLIGPFAIRITNAFGVMALTKGGVSVSKAASAEIGQNGGGFCGCRA